MYELDCAEAIARAYFPQMELMNTTSHLLRHWGNYIHPRSSETLFCALRDISHERLVRVRFIQLPFRAFNEAAPAREGYQLLRDI